MNDFVKSKFTRGDKNAIIRKFKEVENNSTKKSIERLVKKINNLEPVGDKRLKNFYGKNLSNEERKLMQTIGKVYNDTIQNKNRIPRNLALYVAYMHAKKPSPFPIKWKGVESIPIGSSFKPLFEGQKRLSFKNDIFRKLQNYKNKEKLSNKDLNEINNLLEILRKGKNLNFINGNQKKYDNFKNYFEGRRKRYLSEIQSEISTLQNRSTRMGPAAAEVISKNINSLKEKQKSTPLRNIKFKNPKNLKQALNRQMNKFNTKKGIIKETKSQYVKSRTMEEIRGIKKWLKNYTEKTNKFPIFKTDPNFKKTLENALKYLSAGG